MPTFAARFVARAAFAAIAALAAAAPAQTPDAPPAADAPKAPPDLEKALRRSLFDPDGGSAKATKELADAAGRSGKAGRARLASVHRRFAKTIDPAATAGADSRPTAAPDQRDAQAPEDVKAALAALLAADDAGIEAAIAKVKALDPSAAPFVKRASDRAKAGFTFYALTFVRQQIDTNAQFAGQFADLRDLGPEGVALLAKWIKEPPRSVKQPEQFRPACIRALRDVVDPPIPPEIRTALVEAVRGRDSASMQAAFALAQFGDRRIVDELIKQYQAATAAPEPPAQYAGWLQVADVQYNLRDYKAAVDSYRKAAEVEAKLPQPPPGAASTHYNTACSMALAGMIEDAFKELEVALALNEKDPTRSMPRKMLETDMDIDVLRKDPRFLPLLDKRFPKAGSRPAGG